MRVARVLKRRASNCQPWSVVICWGQPKRATQTDNEGFCDCVVGDVKERDCLRPTGVSVDGGETVPEARRHRQRPYQVNMHMRETCRREVETPERGLHVPRYIGSLAGCTCTCPCAAVFPHSRPHKPLGHQLDSGAGSGVAEAMGGVDHMAEVFEGLIHC